jgi:histone deacetylase 6
MVSPAGYGQLTHLLSGLASGKLVVALEGGYNVKAISKSAAAVTSVLLGDPVPRLMPPTVPSKAAVKAVEDTIRHIAPYWKCLTKHRGATTPTLPASGSAATLEDAFNKLGIQ